MSDYGYQYRAGKAEGYAEGYAAGKEDGKREAQGDAEANHAAGVAAEKKRIIKWLRTDMKLGIFRAREVLANALEGEHESREREGEDG